MTACKVCILLTFLVLILVGGCYKGDVNPLDSKAPNCTGFPMPEVDSLQMPSMGIENGAIYLVPREGVEFSLNDTLYQSLNSFSGLGPGNYLVHMKGENNCKSSLHLSLEGKPEIRWISPVDGDTVNAPFTIEFQKWNWINNLGEKEVRLFRNDTLIKVQPLDIDTMHFPSMVSGFGKWELELWNVSSGIQADKATISFFVRDIKFFLRVIRGNGNGFFKAGEKLTVKAKDAKLGLDFLVWVGDSVLLVDPFSKVTSLVMPEYDVTIEAISGIVDTVFYSSQVQPIIMANCANSGCHMAGGIISDFTDFNTVQSKAEEIKTLVTQGTMPPPPESPDTE